MKTLTKFTAQDSKAIANYYKEYGYVVVNNLLDKTKIDHFLRVYESVKRSPHFIFNTQDTHLPSKPKLTPEGLLQNSMLNPSELKFAPQFSAAIEDCIFDEAVSQVLGDISGAAEHIMWQNMFFDRSTGTIDHQDHYYLDTNPAGHLIAAWYALEDIHHDAGCFFVMPGSHRGDLITRNNVAGFDDHEDYRLQMLDLIERSSYEKIDCTLKKGDVLFWHPSTIHGANANSNPHRSRKSFTTHFYPAHLTRQFTDQQIPTSPSKANPQILKAKSSSLASYWRNTKMYLRWGLNKLKGQDPQMIMRRDQYDS
ncbi:MAG: phytanoyl-CoA dioxygenase family protein [Cyanobacteria bacterium J06631_6]